MKTTRHYFGSLVSLGALLFAQVFAQPVFAAVQTVEGYGTDTVAGYETLLKSSKVSPWQDVTFNVTKPDGTTININANSGVDGVAQASLTDYHTRRAGQYGVRASFGLNSAAAQNAVHNFEVFPDKVS